MGFEVKTWWRRRVVVVVAALFMVVSRLQQGADGYQQVPCYFIFGDSLADSGNNNHLNTVAKVNYPPYGIDFPCGPTGRFSNGRTTVDVIAELLGFNHYIPPFATANGFEILFGVNYASGSAGIRNETGEQLGERIPFDKQLTNHQTNVLRMIAILGSKWSAARYLRKCLYTVGLGNNDYINNYFLPEYYSTSQCYTLERYTQLLIQQYKHQLKRLYKYGARKIAIFGLGQLGCTPNAIQTHGRNACVEIMEEASLLFNGQLKFLVEELNTKLPDAKFIYINYYAIGKQSSVLGLKNVSAECCTVESDGPCTPNQIPCKNRTEYAFWDSFHPTEVVNKYIAERSYSALDPSDAYPFDIHSLVQLNLQAAAAQ